MGGVLFFGNKTNTRVLFRETFKMADDDNDFWDFVAFWEFFNPFKDKKEKERENTVNINSLIQKLGDGDEDIYSAAKESLVKIGEPAIPFLIKAMGDERLGVRGGVAWTLIEIGSVVVIPVIEALKNENPEVRFYAAGVLQMLKDERAVEPLIKILKEDKNKKVRNGVSFALFAIKDHRVKEPLKQYGREVGTNFAFEDEPDI